MALFEFRSEIAAGDVDCAEEILQETQTVGWSIVQDVDARRAWLVGTFVDREEGDGFWQRLRELLAGAEVQLGSTEVRPLADAEWKDSYKAHFRPWSFGALHWVPEWERGRFSPGAGEKVLWLDPGMAFGTGNHETTRLCCERLVDFAARRGACGAVTDAGCGSGILALSAARLGFAPVTAFDNDPVAIEVSRENARRNGLSGAVEFSVADLRDGLARPPADLVLANIQADVLIAFAAELVSAVAPGGELVLSGILVRELQAVKSRFAGAAPAWKTASREMGEWADLWLVRPN